MKRWVLNLLLVLFGVTFLVSAFFLGRYFLESKKSADLYSDLANRVNSATIPQAANPPDSTDDNLPEDPETTLPALVDAVNSDTGEIVQVLPEYAEIFEMNSHTVGWIRIDGTPVNYPVLQTPDSPNYYLYRDFNRDNNNHGCIYAREQCDINKPSDNITMYGHWRRDGSMFGSLQKYKQKEYYEAHPIITFDTLTEHHTYEIFCVFRTTATQGEGFPYHLFADAANQQEFDQFISTCKSLQMYDTGKTAKYGDKLISLSTCEYSQTNGRLVIVAKRIA